ncbi:ATP-binding cassette domain-containing protein [Listeria aquatica]|uniref:ATP-binding cassette domain-containing protein n=1 Tax=Listeria aquatica TaxID=1494960 RepID=UPI0031F5C618
MHEGISIQGAKTNNLKNISVSIPKGQITVVTGLSGSGKSSLVFDTLAAESQRLLNETYSSYIQQILPHYEEPDVERIQNLPVSIVINQKKVGGNARSTVGTMTDIYTGLRLLFSRLAQPFIGYSMVYSFNNPL